MADFFIGDNSDEIGPVGSRNPNEMLAAFKVIESGSVEELHRYMTVHSWVHRRSVSGGKRGQVHLRHAPLSQLQVALGYSSVEMTLDIPSNPFGMYYVQIPLTSRLSLRVADREHEVGPGSCLILSPTIATRRWTSDGWTLSFALPSTFVRWRLAIHLGRMPVGDLAFEPVMNRAASPLRSFGLYLVDVIDQGRIDPNDPVTEALERCFADLIIERQPHSQGDGMISSPANVHWERILAVTKFVEDNFQKNIKVADIAHAAGYSVRSLEMFISGFWNCTPKMLINLYRLEVARRLLESGDSSMSVSSAAFDAGFGHPGRFSQMYSDRYGESPSETLQRSRTHGS